MQRLCAILITTIAMAISTSRLAAQTAETRTFISHRTIPDGNPAGISEVTNFQSTISSIGALKVRLRIAGEFNGDLYGYLRHGDRFAVILNRPGKTVTERHGYADQGLDVTCQTGATNGDIHIYDTVIAALPGSSLTGIWEPDGRKMDPARVMDTTSRTTSFTNFTGVDASGEWTLFLADLESGGTNLLSDWSLEIGGAAFPALTWAPPGDMLYGAPLTAAQLNASAAFYSTNVAGTFAYAPPAGTVLNAGLAQPLAVTFTPADPATFLPVSASVTVNVLKAPLTITANDLAKLYGASMPPLTARYDGFVHNDTSSDLTSTVNLSTPATASSDLGTYVITASGGTSSNYSITLVNGALTIYTTNLPPFFTTLTNLVLQPDSFLVLDVETADPNGDDLVISLEPGAPATAILTNRVTSGTNASTNTIVRWVPTRAFASTTNLFTLRVTDNGSPSMSVTQSFTVRVLDYLELRIGSTNLQAGDTVTLPIHLASDGGVSNLTFTIPWAPGYFTNAALSLTDPGIQSATFQDNSTNLVVTMRGSPTPGLQGTQQVATLTFLALSNRHSAFVELPFQTVSAEKPDGSLYENYLTHDGRLAVVQNESLLSPSVGLGSARELTVFGKLGKNYEVQSTTNLFSPNPWHPSFNYLQTNNVMTIDLDSSEPSIFYRLLEK